MIPSIVQILHNLQLVLESLQKSVLYGILPVRARGYSDNTCSTFGVFFLPLYVLDTGDAGVGGEDGVVFYDEGWSDLDGVVGRLKGFVGRAEEG
jgi:hypothetical protein